MLQEELSPHDRSPPELIDWNSLYIPRHLSQNTQLLTQTDVTQGYDSQTMETPSPTTPLDHVNVRVHSSPPDSAGEDTMLPVHSPSSKESTASPVQGSGSQESTKSPIDGPDSEESTFSPAHSPGSEGNGRSSNSDNTMYEE